MASYMASTRTAFIKVRHQVRPDRPVINGLLPQRGLVRMAGMILYFLSPLKVIVPFVANFLTMANEHS